MYPGVTISGTVGYGYMIQRTGNLGDPNSWVTVMNLTLTAPVQLWVDTNDSSPAGNSGQFYRVLPAP